MEYIAFDSRKKYTWASVEDQGDLVKRVGGSPHVRGALRELLAGCEPRLVHAGKAKLMLGMVSKTDKLDAQGLKRLQRTGTLPVVWIPPGELRDKRELTRARMVLVRERHSFRTGSTPHLPSTDSGWR